MLEDAAGLLSVLSEEMALDRVAGPVLPLEAVFSRSSLLMQSADASSGTYARAVTGDCILPRSFHPPTVGKIAHDPTIYNFRQNCLTKLSSARLRS